MAQTPTTKLQLAALESIMTQLAAYREVVVPGDSIVARHEDARIMVPNLPVPMSERDAATELNKVADALETYNVVSRTYTYRPGDGAVATEVVLKRVFGAALGKKTWFSDPQKIVVETALGVSKSVPWGNLQLPITFGADAVLVIGNDISAMYGNVLQLRCKALKSAEPQVEALFDMIATELHNHSIYRGQAVTAFETPTFMDLTNVSEANVVYAEHTARRLDLRLWSRIRLADALAEYGDGGKKIVWLHGDFGTGKSETALLLAKLATEYGWTFIFVPAGTGSWEYALQMLRLYGPRVVLFMEDAETLVKGDPEGVSKFLDQLDGVDAKAMRNTLILFTTNYIEQVQKAATRPGRADSIIRLGNLDRAGTERLAFLELGFALAESVDYDEVYAAMGGAVLEEGGMPKRDEHDRIVFKPEAELTPAFMRQAFNTAKLVAVVAGGGTPAPIDTAAILDGITDLQEQLLIHKTGPEPQKPPTLERSLSAALTPMVHSVVMERLMAYSGEVYQMAHDAADNVVENRINQAQIIKVSNGETWARVVTE